MAHFAQIGNDGIVKRVIVISNSECFDENGNECESVGVAYCEKMFGGRWVQTSYNDSTKGCFAGIGFEYRENADVFIAVSV